MQTVSKNSCNQKKKKKFLVKFNLNNEIIIMISIMIVLL